MLDTMVLVQGFQGTICIFLILVLKVWYGNLNWLEPEPNLHKIVGTEIQKFRLFQYFQFWHNTTG